MDQVLIARKLPCLEKIHIRGKECDPYLLKSWMRAALERNAHELEVKFSFFFGDDSPCELTHDLFSYNKLVILKLSINMKVNFLVKSSGFPNLKFLELDSVIYEDEDSLPNLLASCPILEDLVINTGDNVDNSGTLLNIISRSVKRLKLDVDVDELVIDMPAVEALDIHFLRTVEIVVKDLSSIVDAKFGELEFYSSTETCNTYKLLRGVSNVKCLWLNPFIVEYIQLSDAYDFPVYCNLTRLEVTGSDRCNYQGCPDDKRAIVLQWELVLEILKRSPMLKHLIYEYTPERGDDSSQEYAQTSDWEVPDCLTSSLKTVGFKSYAKCDEAKVRYFMTKAKVLEKMTITHYLSRDCKESNISNATFENRKGSLAETWSLDETVIYFR